MCRNENRGLGYWCGAFLVLMLCCASVARAGETMTIRDFMGKMYPGMTKPVVDFCSSAVPEMADELQEAHTILNQRSLLLYNEIFDGMDKEVSRPVPEKDVALLERSVQEVLENARNGDARRDCAALLQSMRNQVKGDSEELREIIKALYFAYMKEHPLTVEE